MRMTKAEYETAKMNQRLIVNLLDKIIQMGSGALNEELRGQLIDAYAMTQQQLKIESKAVRYLLDKYGEGIEEMISQRVSATGVSLGNDKSADRAMNFEPYIIAP